jgi:hypothetical protein
MSSESLNAVQKSEIDILGGLARTGTFPLLIGNRHYKRPASDPTYYDSASVNIGVKAK